MFCLLLSYAESACSLREQTRPIAIERGMPLFLIDILKICQSRRKQQQLQSDYATSCQCATVHMLPCIKKCFGGVYKRWGVRFTIKRWWVQLSVGSLSCSFYMDGWLSADR